MESQRKDGTCGTCNHPLDDHSKGICLHHQGEDSHCTCTWAWPVLEIAYPDGVESLTEAQFLGRCNFVNYLYQGGLLTNDFLADRERREARLQIQLIADTIGKRP